MGKSWLSAVKKAFSPDPKEKKDQKTQKPKKKWFGKKSRKLDLVTSSEEAGSAAPPPAPPAQSQGNAENVKLNKAEDEQNQYSYSSVAQATVFAAEAAVAAAQAAAEVVRLTRAAKYAGKSKEEIAAIKIQTAFRGYMARRALRALRGLVRLKTFIGGQPMKRQATATLQCMQTLARVQYQIRERRARTSEQNQAYLKQVQQKREKELEKMKDSGGEDWEYSTLSKEQIEASLLSKQEAAMRRERALAYAFTHQQSWKDATKLGHQTFMDPNNPHWGWSWLERWMAARPWDNRSTVDNTDRSSMKSSVSRAASEMSRVHSYRGPSPVSRKQSFRGKRSKLATSPKVGHAGEDDSGSVLSTRSDIPWNRRHSMGSSVKDEEASLESSPSVPSYMASTQAARARSRFSSPSPQGLAKVNAAGERASLGSAKKRLSFSSGSPRAMRRHSGPPRVDTSALRDVGRGEVAREK